MAHHIDCVERNLQTSPDRNALSQILHVPA